MGFSIECKQSEGRWSLVNLAVFQCYPKYMSLISHMKHALPPYRPQSTDSIGNPHITGAGPNQPVIHHADQTNPNCVGLEKTYQLLNAHSIPRPFPKCTQYKTLQSKQVCTQKQKQTGQKQIQILLEYKYGKTYVKRHQEGPDYLKLMEVYWRIQ